MDGETSANSRVSHSTLANSRWDEGDELEFRLEPGTIVEKKGESVITIKILSKKTGIPMIGD
jgi:hypothetical protein